MSEKPTDVPAFPIAGDLSSYQYAGMGLRDYFAAQALSGALARPNSSPMGQPKTIQGYADASYAFADAMLKARMA